MTVKIIHKQQPEYKWITVDKCKVGKAYIDEDGDVFVCIDIDSVFLAGVDGSCYYTKEEDFHTFREVNLTIAVEDITE